MSISHRPWGHAETAAPARPGADRRRLLHAARDAPLSADEAADLALRFKALADPGRLRLLSAADGQREQESCTCDLTELLGLSQPTVSHHLKKLAEAGLVTGERRGVWT